MEIQILYKEEANKFAEECGDIFDNNNKHYIVYRKGIFDHKNFDLLVAVYENHAVGYQIIYHGGDFIKKEGYPEHFEEFHYEDDAVYIWDMCTKLGYENNGIQQKLINFLIKEYPNKNIYSLTDIDNANSMHLQEKLNFKPIGTFKGHFDETYHILVHTPK